MDIRRKCAERAAKHIAHRFHGPNSDPFDLQAVTDLITEASLPMHVSLENESGLVNYRGDKIRELEQELARFRRDYALLEEVSPPDVPRADWVRQCVDALEREQQQTAKAE